ncbi:MAG: hypothetical protein QNJ32_17845 [Xenococcaceae cyanobacterium MO_167.B27]|nr:hypothetical protein [Xenococcaceae cyanobacterium MO_167.B27]
MSQLERLLLMAEDELTQYSTDARKIERLRRKIGISVSRQEQQEIKKTLLDEMPTGQFSKMVEEQRQTVALPFWGIAGLGLLLGISTLQPLDLIATVIGGVIAIRIQRWGWQLEARRLLLNTLEDIEQRIQQPNS